MKYDSRPMGHLVLSSAKQNRLVLLLGGLSLACIILMGLGAARLLEEESIKLDYHFARLMADMREHENFLRNIATHYSAPSTKTTATSLKLILDAKLDGGERFVYQGQQYSVSMPFTLDFNKNYSLNDMHGTVALAVRLADYYGTYWANSDYMAPQILVFAPEHAFSVALPATEYLPISNPLVQNQYLELTEAVYRRLRAKLNSMNDAQVHWEKINAADDNKLIAFMNVDLAGSRLPFSSKSSMGIVTSRLDMDQVEDVKRVLERSIYDTFALISPEGEILLGAVDDKKKLAGGLSFDGHGITIVIHTNRSENWTGVYAISYTTLLRLAKWPILASILIVVGCFISMFLANYWYRKRILLPAQQAHQRLVESQEFIRDIIDSSPTGLSLVRCSDRKVLLKNQSAVHWGGTTQLLDLIECQPESAELCMKVGNRYLRVFFVASRYRGDDVLLCAFIDITQHHADNTALAEAKKYAENASEAKTIFLATISHELRTPLYGVLGNLELLALTELNAKQRKYLQVIENSSASLSALIRDVLDISKIEAGQLVLELTPFSPRDVAEACIGAIGACARAKNIELDIELDERLPALVLGDKERLRQVISNFLNNALKYTEVGRIALRVSVICKSNDLITLSWQVIDTGIGISRLQQALLFKPFYQVPGSSQGSGAGLGLYICHCLSALMGGCINVVSEFGLGSKFSLVLAMEVLAEQDAALELTSSQTHPMNLRILLVEDNPINRAILEEQLIALGAAVVIASNGEEALGYWKPEEFDLVITDVNMPFVNGYELTRRLRDGGETVPIIGVTANALREEGERCLSIGMNACIVKPLTIDALYAAVTKVCPIIRQETAPEILGWDLELGSFTLAMQKLFFSTMALDLNEAHTALKQNDSSRLILYLHRIGGAFGAVGAKDIATQCFRFETDVVEYSLISKVFSSVSCFLHDLEKFLDFYKIHLRL